ncbi:MAG: FkbM family methyltransferase [Hyphomicrobiaceae bacterium]
MVRRWRQTIEVQQHLARHGRYCFRGQPVDLPTDLHLGVRSLIANGRYESAEAALIERHVRPDLPVIELGGCLGLISGFIASRLDPGIPLVVVEANPRLTETCRANATLGGKRPGARVITKAIAYGCDRVAFRLDDNVHISRQSRSNTPDATIIAATTLGAVVAECNSKQLEHGFTLVCDIEGAEYDLFRYDREALSRCALAIVELHPMFYREFGATLDDVLAAASCAGLRIIDREQNTYVFAPAASFSAA